MRLLVTGAAGFISGYLIPDLLARGHEVIGLDNFSKYGRLQKSYDAHPGYRLVEGDAKDPALLKELASGCDQIVAGAAMIGGISYFHELAYDLLAENDRITAATFDAAIWAHKHRSLQRIVVVSSSMVFESATRFPTPEGHERECPPPHSTYGFQKLATEYYALGASQQYQLPYTIVRPFNCVGIGERRARSDREILSGNVKLASATWCRIWCRRFSKDRTRCVSWATEIRSGTTPMAATWRSESECAWRVRQRSIRTSICRRKSRPPCWPWPV
jgi:UDP-glucose 4-epimerase